VEGNFDGKKYSMLFYTELFCRRSKNGQDVVVKFEFYSVLFVLCTNSFLKISGRDRKFKLVISYTSLYI
jgi:hypothetical protein